MKVFTIVAMALALAACSAPEPPEARLPSVLVHTVGGEAGAEGRYFTGEIVARHVSALGFRVGGKLVERQVDVGSVVKRGEVLARLDGTDQGLAVSAARAQVSAAAADLALARSELKRTEALRARNFVSDSAVDSQRTATEAAEARVDEARAQLRLADQQRDYTTLEADADGVVVAVAAEPGQVVAAGQPVLTLARDGVREVVVSVPEGQVAAIAPSRTARVRLWSEPKTIHAATVREVAPAADATTRTFAVKVAVSAPAERLPLGATATVAFDGGGEGGVVLPLRAVGERDGKPVVWVFDAAAGTVAPQPIEVAEFSEAGARVVAGVAPGAQVVVAGIHMLQAGQAVRAVPQGAPVALDAKR